MKNILKMSLLVSLFALPLSSCTKEYITEEYITEEHNHYYNGTWVFSKEYKIGGTSRNVWKYDSPGIYYCDIPIVELTQQIYDEGMLAAYFVYQVDSKLVDSQLPFNQFDMNNEGYQWTYEYSCEFSPGLVTFVFKDSSFFEENPPACTFVVKMMR